MKIPERQISPTQNPQDAAELRVGTPNTTATTTAARPVPDDFRDGVRSGLQFGFETVGKKVALPVVAFTLGSLLGLGPALLAAAATFGAMTLYDGLHRDGP